MAYEERWYWCTIREIEDDQEPLWDRIPEERLEMVRERWEAARARRLETASPRRWKLWGPQIERYYLTDPRMIIKVEEPVSDHA